MVSLDGKDRNARIAQPAKSGGGEVEGFGIDGLLFKEVAGDQDEVSFDIQGVVERAGIGAGEIGCPFEAAVLDFAEVGVGKVNEPGPDDDPPVAPGKLTAASRERPSPAEDTRPAGEIVWAFRSLPDRIALMVRIVGYAVVSLLVKGRGNAMAVVKRIVTGVDVNPARPGQVVRRDLLGPADGAPNFTMRQFDLIPGAATPLHAHAWEHEVLILQGAGKLLHQDGEAEFAAGDTVFVPPLERHQFSNTGRNALRFICVVPNSGHIAGLSREEKEILTAAGVECEG